MSVSKSQGLRHRGGRGGRVPPIFESAGDNPPIIRIIVGQIRWVFGFSYAVSLWRKSWLRCRLSPRPPQFHRRGGAPAKSFREKKTYRYWLLRAEREARSEFFCGLREKSHMRGPTPPNPTRPNPTRSHDAFERLISLERVDRFTSGLLCSMSPFNKFRIWPVPIPTGAWHGTCLNKCRCEGESARAHVHARRSISRTTAGWIAFKFCVWLREPS